MNATGSETSRSTREPREQVHPFEAATRECAVFLVSREGVVWCWNPGAERLFGYSSPEITGQHFSRIFSPEDVRGGQPEHELRSALNNGHAENARWQIRKDGTRFWCRATTTPLFDEHQQLRSFARVVHELSDDPGQKLNGKRTAVAVRVNGSQSSPPLQQHEAFVPRPVLSEPSDERLGFEKIVGTSQAILDVFEQARMTARADCTVLVTGESGTGKELVAEALHQNSARRTGPFMTVNMAAVPEHLVESELFGHVKGAFTGALAARLGRFEAAHTGTLFIDEIGDFALSSQSKLLRVLENHLITPVGCNDDKQVDVWAISATSRNLEEMVQTGKFREDLYYRLNVVTIHLPALRDRAEDIPQLAAHFLKIFSTAHGKPGLEIAPDLMEYLACHSWPGNVRQLRNAIENMVVLARGERLTFDNLPASLESKVPVANFVHAPATPPPESLLAQQRLAVENALAECRGHRTRAAQTLGISVRTLQRKLKTWGLVSIDQQLPPLAHLHRTNGTR